ncbi:MAG: MoxR family ATPase [Firmicutes bacterium]|nr:MoxR family ATPase [Bacillota bacterium]
MQVELAHLQQGFADVGYICDQNALLTVYLALKLQKPLLIEGAPGVGKTELGKTLAKVLKTELIRLQCYEGLDETKALYEWNYQRQLLRIQMDCLLAESELVEEDLFSLSYLLERPLLKAIRAPEKKVLLIDEIDKCDPEFEAFLLEVLSDFQISIPELGTLHAENIPAVVLTSNNERELSDGLKRRCLYLYFNFPDVARESQIIRTRVPEIGERFAVEIARVIAHIRSEEEMRKKPSIAETLDWTRALVALGNTRVDGALVSDTLNLLLKNRQDQLLFHRNIGKKGVDELLQQPAGRGGGV